MTFTASDNLDYLATRLHGRRNRMAEGQRLNGLCKVRSIAELSRSLGLDTEYQTAAEFQSRLIQDLIRELKSFVRHVDGAGGEIFTWMLVRFQLENIKLRIRGLVNQTPPEVLHQHLLPLPESLALDATRLAEAKTLDDLVELSPAGSPRERLGLAVANHKDHPEPFFLEAALDGGYFQELLVKTRRLDGEDLSVVRPLVVQEANFFQFMLATRGRFQHGLSAEALLELRLPGISENWFRSLLTAPDLLTAAKSSVGVMLDELPDEGGLLETGLEALGWTRFRRLANSAFRRSHMGLGAVIGYAGLRRVETANLITLSEGIRNGMAVELIRARLVPGNKMEAAYV